jgi:hypothetical protein
MTDTGPENARQYTAILAGNAPPEDEDSRGQGQPAEPPSLSGITQQYPESLTDLSNAELRQLVNILNGVKEGQKGSAGKRTKRGDLLKMVSGMTGSSSSAKPPSPLPTASAALSRSTGNDPGQQPSLPGGFPGLKSGSPSAEGPSVGFESPTAQSPAVSSTRPSVASPATTQPPEPSEPPKRPQGNLGSILSDIGAKQAKLPGITKPHVDSLADLTDEELRQLANLLGGTKEGQKGAAGKRTGRDVLLKMVADMMGVESPQAAVGAGVPPFGPTGDTAAPAGPDRDRDPFPDRDPSKPWNSRGFRSLIASPLPPGSTEPTPGLTSSPVEAPPVQTPGSPFAPEREVLGLREAIERLTTAIDESGQKVTSVADDTRGMSLGERFERLKKSGNLMGEEDVKAATLKEEVTPRDVIIESERTEQKKRDDESAKRKTTVGESGEDLVKSIGSTTEQIFSRLAGNTVGGYAGRQAELIARPFIEGRVKRAGGVVAGTGGGVTSAVVGVLKTLVSNPYAVASDIYIAALKLPGIVEKFATSVAESQRHLAKYNAQLASTYARLDYQKRLLEMQTAGATSGTNAVMTRELMELRKETQWMRETWANTKNVLVTLTVEIARLVNFVTQSTPEVIALRWAMEKLNELFGKSAAPNTEIMESMTAMAKYTTPQVKNRKPQQLRSGGERKGDSE